MIVPASVSRVLEPCWELMHRSRLCSTLFLLRGFETIRWRVGEIGAQLRYHATVRQVPAYRTFVSTRATALGELPITDKATYVNAYPMASRCIGGVIPSRGVVIDESSGSSGHPTNWIRGGAERAANARTIRRGLEHRFGRGPLFVINAFALGPWATGINLTLALSSWCRLKSLGPDIAKIINTLTHFGPSHRYLIMGYPPFLKQLIDCTDVDWSAYSVSFVFGGEGMSESMRRYMHARGVARVYGSYGASDLELNIGAETDLTIALRQLMEARPEIAALLQQHHGAQQTGGVPMIFQFNPADFFIETTPDGELLVTVCRPDYVAPKVRYNIHDVGSVLRYPTLRALLATAGVDITALAPKALNLPLLFLYGRSDMSVSWYGCKITPSDIQDALFRTPELSSNADGFQLRAFDDDAGDKQLVVAIETRRLATAEEADAWSLLFFDALAAVNQDFRESRRMAPTRSLPRLALHQQGTGPFEGADNKIKRQYLPTQGLATVAQPEAPMP
jgi:phenylacetate-CoA ligase